MRRGRADASIDACVEIFRALCIGVDSPRSLKAYLLTKYGEWEQLARFSIHPLEYCDSYTFSGDYAVVSFLKKNGDLPQVADTRAVAVQGFITSERNCAQVNSTFKAWTSGSFCLDPDVARVLHAAQQKIVRLIGVEPTEPDRYSWGPGATFDIRRTCAYPDTKLLKLPLSVTGNALKKAASLINSDLHWKEAIIAANSSHDGAIFQTLRGGRYDTVPKTVLTDRSILVEPTLNTVLQKSYGAQLRAHLKKVRVDLDDQSWNQSLASFAKDAGLATLDLEAASDSVTTELVRFLLPPVWFDALDEVRSREAQIDGEWVPLEKFSSMGNGFTFELESLIFWALSASCNDVVGYTPLGIYGDDIIVRREVVPLLTRVLATCGFRLNQAKSFIDGEFFESCGHHFYGSQNVTPAYQKENPGNDADRFRLANRLLRLACRLGSPSSPDKRIEAAWRCAIRVYKLDRKVEFFGPYVGEGDGYLEVPFEWIRAKSRRGFFGTQFRIKRLVVTPVEIPGDDRALLALWLMGRGGSIDVERRRRTLREEALSASRHTDSIPSYGMLPSRVSERVRARHSWVDCSRLSTLVTW